MRGAHEAVKRAKLQKLAVCSELIRGQREHLRAGPGTANEAGPRMADLVAYKSLIESVSEWPIDVPQRVRLALYLLLPLGSWVAGALVEHVVDGVLR